MSSSNNNVNQVSVHFFCQHRYKPVSWSERRLASVKQPSKTLLVTASDRHEIITFLYVVASDWDKWEKPLMRLWTANHQEWDAAESCCWEQAGEVRSCVSCGCPHVGPHEDSEAQFWCLKTWRGGSSFLWEPSENLIQVWMELGWCTQIFLITPAFMLIITVNFHLISYT